MGELLNEKPEEKDNAFADSPFPLTDTDRWVLSQTDEEFHLHDWEELKVIIGEFQHLTTIRYCLDLPGRLALVYRTSQERPPPTIVDVADLDVELVCCSHDIISIQAQSDTYMYVAENNLSILKRKPSDLRRYMAWSAEIKAKYGSMVNYLLQHRLPWGAPPFTYVSSIPFDNMSDYKVLINDWPYGLTPDITHIVVWSKTPIATDEATGDMTDESRKVINDFVKRTFVDRLGGDRDRVMWFKNWVALQSVRALEHVHVLVKNVTDADIEFWTGGKP